MTPNLHSPDIDPHTPDVVTIDTVVDQFIGKVIDEAMIPCPFCGQSSALRVIESPYGGKVYYWIYCARTEGGCGIAQDSRIHRSEAAAITVWNTRADDKFVINSYTKAVFKKVKIKLLRAFAAD